MKNMRSWLRGHGRLSGAAAGQIVRNGRALEHLPALEAAFADGAVTAEQVAVVAPVARADRQQAALEQGIDLAEIDRVLAAVAAERHIEQLTRAVRHYLSCLDPDGPEPDPTDEPVADRLDALRRHGRLPRPARCGRRGEAEGGAGVGRAGRPAQG